MIIRSAKVPLSPSSALQRTYLRSETVSITVFHLIPVGNPAPPRPRSPESVTVLTISAGVVATAFARPFSPPCAL